MSHVDEGTIHAWLDGAFGPDDPERLRIEAHLESCAECREAVETERRIARSAAEILGHAVPDNVTVEPFEKMLAARRGGGGRGGAVMASPVRRVSYRVPMTLAATVMLAVTATWFAREYLPATGRDALEPASTLMEQGAPGESAAAGALRQDQAESQTSPASADAANARNEQVAVENRAVPGRAVGAVTAKNTTERESAAAAPPAAAPPVAEPPATREARDRRLRTQEETRGLAAAVMRSVAAVEAPAVVFADIEAGDNAPADSTARPINATVLALIDSVTWTTADLDAVGTRFGGRVAGLDGMTPDSVLFATTRGVPLVRLVYHLADASTIDLVQWPMGAIPDVRPADADRDQIAGQARALALDEIVIVADQVDLLLRGRIAPDSLTALLKRVRRSP